MNDGDITKELESGEMAMAEAVDTKLAWQTPELQTFRVSLDTQYYAGSGGDGMSYTSPPF